MAELKGVFDLHIHSAPDIRERKHDDLELLRQAQNMEVEGFVLKSHQFPTAERAWVLNKLAQKNIAYGSITLNYAVGGLNPAAVRYAMELGAKIVWLPTIDAKNHRLKEGKQGGISVIRGNSVVAELLEIMEIIKEYNAVLATGHISTNEIDVVLKTATDAGITNIMVTHPEFHIVGLSIKEQIDIASKYDNVYFERTFAQPIGKGNYQNNLPANLEAINKVGYQTTLVSTDSGQIENPPWNESLPAYINFLKENGVKKEALDWMTKKLPAKLLNLN
ncbi:DUF6282 family protein [Terribacillus saccharophilus]|uniref:DUF6282 family protein n=1 Tax=Terribacillus saccharophilus TaxID=361277 RepID=UPI003D2C4C65